MAENDMTEEEAQYCSDFFMKNPPKTDPSKPGVFAQRKTNRFLGMDNLTVNYLLTKSIETNKTPEEIIGDLVRKELTPNSAGITPSIHKNLQK